MRVNAPSRLHFGLLALPSEDSAVRRFGGAGMMIRQPELAVRVEPAAAWSARGPRAERALEYARRFAGSAPERAFALHVEHAGPEHVGLGAGTQLGMTVAKALAVATGEDLDAVALARRIGRGERSAIGVHGFARGGFLVDGGKGPATTIAPLLSRLPFPEEWRMLLAIPRREQGLHGPAEREAFLQAKESATNRVTEELAALLLLGVLPALAERNLATFGPALAEFNRKVGAMFAPWQGGVYATAQAAALVDHLTAQGAPAGQSSWGPTVFAVAEEGKAHFLRNRLKRTDLAEGCELLVVSGCNTGATVDK